MQNKLKVITVSSISLAVILHALSKYYIFVQRDVPHILHLLIAVFYFSFAVSHSVLNIGKQNTIVFFLIIVVGGGIFEFIKTSSGYMRYSDDYGLKLLGRIPLIIPFWMYIISYIAFSMTNIINGQIFIEKIPHRQSNIYIHLSSLVDSFIVLGFLVIAAPIDTVQKEWIWRQPGIYYGVPISFYILWFVAIFIFFSSYRFYERYFPPKEWFLRGSLINIIPALVYFCLIISGGISSILNNLNLIAFIGFFVMFPYVLLSLIYFFNHYIEDKNINGK